MATETQETAIIEEKFETAKEFLDALRITNDRWISKQNNWETSWIFRGQSDSTWQLIPSAWRGSNLERFKQKYRAKFEQIYLVPLERELKEIAKLIGSGKSQQMKVRKELKPAQIKSIIL